MGIYYKYLVLSANIALKCDTCNIFSTVMYITRTIGNMYGT
jgi:hypothetical protein